VQPWDRGYWLPEASDPATAIRKGELKFVVESERLHGGFVLVQIRNRPRACPLTSFRANITPRVNVDFYSIFLGTRGYPLNRNPLDEYCG